MTDDNLKASVILIVSVLILFVLCNQLYSSDVNTESGVVNKIKGLEIMFLKLSTCPYCIKMESFLLSKNLIHYMHIIDVQTGEGRKIAQDNQLSGFPSFVSKKTGKKTSGFTEDINKLINDLE